jgi:ribonuclease HI
MNLIIYTDGSCISNTHGGWAFVCFEKNIEWLVSGGEANTTNNRMELIAVIKALDFNKEYTNISIHSDSMYVINCATGKYKRNKNKDLWNEYDTVSKNKNILFTHVYAHKGDKYNELCDYLAKLESREIQVKLA